MSEDTSEEVARAVGAVRSIIAADEYGQMTACDMTRLLAKIDNYVTHSMSLEAWHRMADPLTEMLRGLDRRVSAAYFGKDVQHFGCLGRLKDLVGHYRVVGCEREISTDPDDSGVTLEPDIISAVSARRRKLRRLLDVIRTDDDLSGVDAIARHNKNNEAVLSNLRGNNGVRLTETRSYRGSTMYGVDASNRGTGVRASINTVVHLTLGLWSKDTDYGRPPDRSADYRPITYYGILLPAPPEDLVAYLAQEFGALYGLTTASAVLMTEGPSVIPEPEYMAVLWRLEPPHPEILGGTKYAVTCGPRSRARLDALCRRYLVRTVRVGDAVCSGGAVILDQIATEDSTGVIRAEDICMLLEDLNV